MNYNLPSQLLSKRKRDTVNSKPPPSNRSNTSQRWVDPLTLALRSASLEMKRATAAMRRGELPSVTAQRAFSVMVDTSMDFNEAMEASSEKGAKTDGKS